MCGFSPTARSRKPKRVRYSSHHEAGTRLTIRAPSRVVSELRAQLKSAD